MPRTLCIRGRASIGITAALWSVVSRPRGHTHTCQFLNTSLASSRYQCPSRCCSHLASSGSATWNTCYLVGGHPPCAPWLSASLLLLSGRLSHLCHVNRQQPRPWGQAAKTGRPCLCFECCQLGCARGSGRQGMEAGMSLQTSGDSQLAPSLSYTANGKRSYCT